MNGAITVSDIRFEFYRFITAQRCVCFINKLVKRSYYRNLETFLDVFANVAIAEELIINLVKSGVVWSGPIEAGEMRKVCELSRRWAVRIAKVKIEYALDTIKYNYTR